MTTYPAPTYQHTVVPICGAAFVPPALAIANGYPASASASSSSPSSSRASMSPTSSPTSSYSPHSSAYPYRSADARASTSSGSFSGNGNGPSSPVSPREAALAYSKMLHSHTASMWELERQNIERARLEAPRASSSASPRKGHRTSASTSAAAGYIRDPAPPVPAVPAPAEHTSKPSAMSFLLGRARSARKVARNSESEGKSTGGHKRGKSTVY